MALAICASPFSSFILSKPDADADAEPDADAEDACCFLYRRRVTMHRIELATYTRPFGNPQGQRRPSSANSGTCWASRGGTSVRDRLRSLQPQLFGVMDVGHLYHTTLHNNTAPSGRGQPLGLHCRLAKFPGLMRRGKFSAVIG
jgi:hypothetical protein